MKRLLLVSHGQFASGLHNALEMLTGKRDDIISFGLREDQAVENFSEVIADTLDSDTEGYVVLADIIGGSPLTTTLQVLDKQGKMENTMVIGGMNLPLALTAVLMKDTLDAEELQKTIIEQATTAIQPFVMEEKEEAEI